MHVLFAQKEVGHVQPAPFLFEGISLFILVRVYIADFAKKRVVHVYTAP